MTPEKFDRAASKTRLQTRGRFAARAVLVEGEDPAEVARLVGVSKQAVEAYVKSVLRQRGPSHPDYPASWQTITVTVPRRLANQIRKMAREARNSLSE